MTFDPPPIPRFWLSLAAAVAAASAPASALAGRFNGFQPSFNLGLSPSTNLVCAATRTYDAPEGTSARTWDITCRGIGDHALGTIYIFHGANRIASLKGWEQRTQARFDCDEASGSTLERLVSARRASMVCKVKGGGVDYRFEARAANGYQAVVMGNKAIEDLLAVAADYVGGRIDEPDARKVANYSVSSVSTADLAEIVDQAPTQSTGSEFRRAYQLNYDWDFDKAEEKFSVLSNVDKRDNNIAAEVESLYNLALNASNNGQEAFAQFTFDQAEKEASENGLSNIFQSLSLNYQAMLLRNRGAFAAAEAKAFDAVEARAKTAATGPFERQGGALRILAGEQDVDNGKLSDNDRNALMDVQAYQVAATCMEALGQREAAADLLDKKAIPILERFGATGSGFKSRPLGEALPWLNLRVQADALRLNRLTGRPVDVVAFRRALAAFGRMRPASLPLAGSMMELASAEAGMKDMQDQALRDYESAFAIFRDKRGALGPSADLAGGYFEILLERIQSSSGGHDDDISRFFMAAQTLTSQASVKAAREANAQRDTADPGTALLHRNFETAEAEVDAQTQAFLAAKSRGDEAAAAAAEAARQRLAKDAQDLEAKLAERDPGYAGRLETQVKLQTLKDSLGEGEAYVKAFLLAKQGFGILIDHTSATPYRIDLSRKEARCLVERFRGSMARKAEAVDEGCVVVRTPEFGEKSLYRFDVEAAGRLFETVFGPVQAQALKAKALIYEPDATLIGAPISALVVDRVASEAALEANEKTLSALANTGVGTSGNRNPRLSYVGVDWLGNHLANSIALDAATFVGTRGAKPSEGTLSYLGLGDPVIVRDPKHYSALGGGKPACEFDRELLAETDELPATSDEVRSISASFGGPPAAVSRLRTEFTDLWIVQKGKSGDLKNYKVIYFATHGILLPDHPCLGVALLTSVSPDGGDGLLDLDEIFRLHLDADMVVLSACNTGIAKGGGSEALGGLVRSFIVAQARNLVVSNWSVNADQTARLMKTMFAARHVSQVEALTSAERQIAADPVWSHPYFWAPFSIVGDAAKPIPDLASSRRTVGE